MKKFTGIPVSYGTIIGIALLYSDSNIGEIPHYTIQKSRIQSEWERFINARSQAADELKALCKQISGKEQLAIAEAHIMMLEDADFEDQIKERLHTNLENIEWAVWSILFNMKEMLMTCEDPYLKERSTDITDIAKRLMYKLLPVKRISLADLKNDVILVSHELLPSDMLGMNKNHVKGIVTETGSKTSHAAILARAFAIPAVLGLSNITKEINEGAKLFVNGDSGEVIINPGKSALTQYKKDVKKNRKITYPFDNNLRNLPTETLDGHKVCLKANIGSPQESGQSLAFGAEGIGLYRSEFLFMAKGDTLPTEEEQFCAYKQVIEAMGKLPVTIRTLDAGGDKIVSALKGEKEEKNPLLGWRAIRVSLSMPELFKTQLRALLRASIYGNLQIMFPMISDIDELERALDILEEAKKECKKNGHKYADIAVGTMIEVPSAAVTADIIAKKSDFFSIGTNDLIQYTFAADRENEKVSYLGKPSQPAVIRLIKKIIDSAREKGIKASMCGEVASDISATALLLGLGLEEFSMTSQSIPQVKQIIRNVEMKNCRILAEEVLKCSSSKQIIKIVDEWMTKNFSG